MTSSSAIQRALIGSVLGSIFFIGLLALVPQSAAATPAAPNAIYWVTNSSNNVYTTSCTSATGNCSLRGAVQLANASSGGDTIYISTSVTSIILTSPITLTGGSITIQGNGSEAVTDLKTNGNFPALVLNSDNNVIRGFWITSNGSHAGALQHGIVINGDGNTIDHTSLSGLGGDGVYITGRLNVITASLIGVQTLNGTQWAMCGYNIDRWGIFLDGANNNTISHNTIGCSGQDGVALYGNSYNNSVIDNYVGVVNWGGHVPNASGGITAWNGATVNHIGDEAHGNIIGANAYGVKLYGGNTQNNEVWGNSIGISGTLNISNTLDGVNVQQGATGNWIEYNDIAYNGFSGVALVVGAPANWVYHNTIHQQAQSGIWIGDSSDNNVDINWIGVQTSGGHAVAGCTFANGNWGIRLDNAANTSIDSNIIGCSGYDGVGLYGTGTYSNTVYANWIGVTDSGGRVPNTKAGVALWGGAHNNQIGRSDYGNVIGANKTFGVYLSDSGTATNTIQMNSIGISSTLNISNTYDGVALIGGTHDNRLFTNTIAYKGHNGVWLSDAGTNINLLQANVIRKNQLAGVAIQNGASANWIGLGGPRALGNVISANAFDGVYISDNTTVYNAVADNYIGTTAAGNVADPNGGNGVKLDNGTFGNSIGWSAAERNVIAGNTANGVLIVNGAHDNWVRFNDIGTNRDFPLALNQAPKQPSGGGTDYLAIPNGGGINIYNAYTNTIGASSADNFIEYNHRTGIYVAGGSHGNVIGSNIVRNSDDYGVLLDGGNTAYNTITRTQVFSNGLDGIGERNGAGLNVWSEVGIHDNGGLGIDKNASNDGQNLVNPPNLTFDSINKQTGVVHGHADASVVGTVIVELYRVSPDPSGYGEGGVFIGKTTTDASGSWTITNTSPVAVRGCYTAFVTESQLVIPFSSSEFSANTCRVFTPLILKH